MLDYTACQASVKFKHIFGKVIYTYSFSLECKTQPTVPLLRKPNILQLQCNVMLMGQCIILFTLTLSFSQNFQKKNLGAKRTHTDLFS